MTDKKPRRTAEQIDIFGNTSPVDDRTRSGKPKHNPCIAVFGEGPEGTKCKECAHLLRFKQSKTWYKCAYRRNTNSPRTDHSPRWPACGKFTE